MKSTRTISSFVLALILASGAVGGAQDPTVDAEREPASLSIEVTIARFQGETLVSSLPYTLSAIPGEEATLRIGAEVPVRTVAGATASQVVNYRPIGTNISCSARRLAGDRYEFRIFIDESSVYGDNQTATDSVMVDVPVFRSFQSGNSFVIRNGQSIQYTAAADRISGETVRVDVELTVLP